ncbi:MAG: HNH endonuclease [Candidatus Scalindua rubra]|uniref:HNH endonuclease n=1 Tax=Candidatus Scalindua brodae TaxID=237368 RepID=A0A0B0EJ47_9BACT|nr:MAG: HNH endonuclease [Candidatus Scalindua brodae]MBZ0108417.1 HNH endonuclease [Candidatus Scalindua rubra]TWU31889.1 HNH endonuclease [Candidatus Brocadiaceae bacterium S225]
MATYLYLWVPKNWEWKTLNSDVEAYQKRGFFDSRWSCGVTKKIAKGDRAFLIKLGTKKPTGIMASGYSLSEPFEKEHYSDPQRTALYTDIRYDILLHPEKERLLECKYLNKAIPEVKWSPRAGGMTIPPEQAEKLEEIWKDHLLSSGLFPITLAEEVFTPEKYREGATRRISVNAYERDPRARKDCLAHHGYFCTVCGFDFEKVYGDLGKGFIHVHHIRPLGKAGEAYEVDPVVDLIPVCPNCHAMIHREKLPYTIEKIKESITVNKSV